LQTIGTGQEGVHACPGDLGFEDQLTGVCALQMIIGGLLTCHRLRDPFVFGCENLAPRQRVTEPLPP
jgi:hypothetical protein